MYLIYFDESGQSGNNLNDPAQPVFVLAALIVPEDKWQAIERQLQQTVQRFFPGHPAHFEIHATEIHNARGWFRQFPIQHRLDFRDECLRIAAVHGLKLVYRAIVKKRFQNWIVETFGEGVSINPHVVAFALVARVVDDYLKTLPGAPLGIFISDENREVVVDLEKAIRLLRVAEGTLRLERIIEKGFFIDSQKSLLLQLCDLCVYAARRKEEAKAGLPVKPIDQGCIPLVEPLIHRGNEALLDTIGWIIEQQKKERPGDKPGSA